MNILITGICGLRNKGVEALLRTVIAGIESHHPNSHFQVPTYTPGYDRDTLGQRSNLEWFEDPYMRTGSWWPPAHIPRSWKGKLKRKLITLKKGAFTSRSNNANPVSLLPYKTPDLVIVSGGDLYSSDYGHANLRHFLEPIHWAHAHGIPCILLAQSVGIFKNEADLVLWKETAKKVSLITVREPLSRDYLVNETGVALEKVILTADTAFLMQPDAATASWVRSTHSSPVVAVSISQGICEWSGIGTEGHIATWTSLIRHILDNWGARVLIVPHVQETYCDDRLVSSKVWRDLSFDSRVTLAGADFNALEYKGMISACDMVIAERMHACIAGLSTAVPTVPVGYSIKARGITTQVFEGTGITPDSIVIPSDTFVDSAQCIPHMDSVWQRRDAIASALQSRLPAIKALAESNFDLLGPYLKKLNS